jgi:uncharacterized membrane protein YhaH (DUF805 family)
MSEITQDQARDFDKVEETSQSVGTFLFSPRGRIPRRAFWGFHLVSYTVLLCGVSLLDAINVRSDTVEIIALVFFVPIAIAWVYSAICIRVKRFHDMDCSGFYCLFLLIPYISFLASLFLYLSRGTKDANGFGPDPNLVIVATQ